MPARANVQAPTSIVHTDDAGVNAAGVAKAPPTSGTDYGVQVYANLGSASIPVTTDHTGAPNLAHNQVALNSSTATSIVAANATRRSVVITNNDAAIVIYIGKSGVTSSTGHKLAAGQSFTMPFVGQIFGISASATPSVSYSEFYD